VQIRRHVKTNETKYPGALQVMSQGVEGSSIFRRSDNREDFLTRLEVLSEDELLSVDAWALLDNHFHLPIRTGKQRILLYILCF
jgi:hypothetical protein